MPKGAHRLTLDRDAELSAPGAGPATIDVPDVSASTCPGQSNDYTALSMAPIVYARANTVGKFTDLPLLMWYEVVPTPRGRQYRYSVIFSNEDGGTQTDRLMATWGRTTDIEFVYGVEVDADRSNPGRGISGARARGPGVQGHARRASPAAVGVDRQQHGQRDRGRRRVRYAPAPVKFDLTDQAREAVMDANPWTYAIAAVEMRREGKIADDAPPGINKIPDPRRFVFVEACGTIGNAALSVSVGSRQSAVSVSVATVI